MNITRRSLFKRAAAVLAVAPFLSLTPTAFSAPLEPQSKKNFLHTPESFGTFDGKEDEWRQIPVYPRFTKVPVNQPSREDPLGQFGFVAMRYTVNGKQYGDYIKVSDVYSDYEKALLQHETIRLRLINPRAYFAI